MFRLVVLAAVLALLAGCGATATSAHQDGRLQVVVGFYPLQFVAQRVGDDHVVVANLTKAGAEPHDLELAPRDVAAVDEADVVLYLRGFQPALDDAVTAQATDTALDVAKAARLDLLAASLQTREDAPAHLGAGSPRAALDPHFWLDPTRLADVADATASRFAEIDPAHADEYRRNAAALRTDLHVLDDELRQGLAHCASRDLVTSHSAFGYLARRYGLEQVGIEGLNPEGEPRPQDLAEVARFAREHHVSTVYYETLVSPDVARTVARETGARTAVLDPLEGLTDQSAGSDYLQVMRANLETLRKGQSCR
ncbi:MAG: metal ABC transporter substrate-binding protein [Actinomycetes bacterium]